MTELILQTIVNAVYAASYMSLIAVGLVLMLLVLVIKPTGLFGARDRA